MDRRTFLTGACVASAGAATGCSPDSGQEGTAAAPAVNRRQTRRLRMVTTWPKGFPGLGTAAERTAQFIQEMSGGEIEVEVYGAGEIVGAFEVFDAVSIGVADMYHAAEYYWQGRSPAYNFFCAVPLGMTAAEIMAWVEFGGGQELWNELAGQFNLIAFQAGNTGHQMGGWFKQEVNSLEDFRGCACVFQAWVDQSFANWAAQPSPYPAVKSIPPCNRARSTRLNGSVHGMTWPSVSTVKRHIITAPASMSRARHWDSVSIWVCGKACLQTIRPSSGRPAAPRTINRSPSSPTRTGSHCGP